MRSVTAFYRERRGSSAAEFVIVLPLMLLFLFGIIDAGRYAWLLNQLEKGAQAGVRYAVVTNAVPRGLNAFNPVGFRCADGQVIETADRICPEALGTISCGGAGGTSCSCVTGPCPAVGTVDGAAFANIVQRVSRMAPLVQPVNVTVRYSGSGLGFAGDPTVTDGGAPLSDISPLVTVEVSGVEFRAFMLFGSPIDMPVVSSSLTMEDGTGTIGY